MSAEALTSGLKASSSTNTLAKTDEKEEKTKDEKDEKEEREEKKDDGKRFSWVMPINNRVLDRKNSDLDSYAHPTEWHIPVRDERHYGNAEEPCCGEKITMGVICFIFLGSWFMVIVSLSCTPWDYMGPMAITTAAVFFILLSSFVPLTKNANGLISVCAKHNMKKKGGVCEDLHPITGALLAILSVAAASIMGYLISRETLPNVAVSELHFFGSMVSGRIVIPWCADDMHLYKGGNSLSTFPFDVSSDGRFYGQISALNNNTSLSLVASMTASCGKCFSSAIVTPFSLNPPGFNGTATLIPFFDRDAIGTYAYPSISICFLTLALYAVFCIRTKRPFCKPPSNK